MVKSGLSHVPPPKTTLALFHVMKPGLHGPSVTVIVMSKTVPITGTPTQEMEVLHVPTQPTSPKPKPVLLVLLKTVLCMVLSVMMKPIVLMVLLVHVMNVDLKPMVENIVIG